MSDAVIDLDDDDDQDEEKLQHGSAAEELKLVEAELKRVDGRLATLLQRQRDLQTRRDKLQQIVDMDTRAPRADWQGQFAWDERAKLILEDVFKLTTFRAQQQQVINATMQGRDVLCLMPSGGGKSLCYQLPALLGNGCTLVVSPLLSLIQDQELGLRDLGINVLSLTSLSPKEVQSEVYRSIDSDASLKLLYVTPERVVKAKRFMAKLDKLHKAGRLDRIAIDEAHCCSQWGNDFRPDYKKLGILKQQFPDVPILALTATATRRVQTDLTEILRISGCELFKASIDRPNLYYEVRWKPAMPDLVIDDMVAWISQQFGPTKNGIVYCLTRKDAEAVCAQLTARGVSAGFYHADMEPGTRQAVHLAWARRKIRVIVATIAFGMGINKADVRFVIHHGLSKSIENYYQESGRAGRDGLPARCRLYYRPADVMRQAALTCSEPGWDHHLLGMMRYAQMNSGCRRSVICRHFAEPPAPCQAGCDACKLADGQPVLRDISAEASAIVHVLTSVPTAEKRLTLIQLIERWRASKVPAEQQLAKADSKDGNEQLIGHLLEQGILQFEFGFTAYATNAYLKASPTALAGRISVSACFPVEAAADEDEVESPPKRGSSSARSRAKKPAGSDSPESKPKKARKM